MEETEELSEMAERVAALDIGKASVMACIRVPHADQRRRRQEVCEYGTTTGALLALAGHLPCRTTGTDMTRFRTGAQAPGTGGCPAAAAKPKPWSPSATPS
jgi:hypothetical protein